MIVFQRFAVTEAAFSNFKCPHVHSNVTAENIVGHLSSKTKSVFIKLDRTEEMLRGSRIKRLSFGNTFF